ncbi:hypothetical protein Hanom_Chr16g01474001 [Helianthus anomalus]
MAAIDLTSRVALYPCTVTNPACRRGSTTAQPRAAVSGSITFDAAFWTRDATYLLFDMKSLKIPL